MVSVDLILLLVVATESGNRTTPTLKQSISIKRASHPRISPDGEFVAFEVKFADWKANKFKTQIWMSEIPTRRTYSLTNQKNSNWHARWGPKSEQLAFLSDRTGKPQIFIIRCDGGEPFQVTDSETGVKSFAWSPDGKWIAFCSAQGETRALKERKEKFGNFLVVDEDLPRDHLWMIEVFGGKAVRLTGGEDYSVREFAWSPSGNHIAFSAGKTSEFRTIGTVDLFLLELDGKKVRKIVDSPGYQIEPVWSPTGDEILYLTSSYEKGYFYRNTFLAVVSLENGKTRILTQDFNERPLPQAWGEDGIYFAALEKTNLRLFRLDPKTGEYSSLPVSFPVVSSEYFSDYPFTFSKNKKMMAFLYGRANRFPEVAVSPVAKFQPKKLTQSTKQLAKYQLATREIISWKSKDGTVVEGILWKPAEFNPKKNYPLLVCIHGGPISLRSPVLEPNYFYPLEQFVAKGALVLQPNYRGSAGYGERFRSLNVRNLGVGDAWDILSGVDFLIQKGFVDSKRLGVMGWSQGGYISAYLGTSCDRFRAVSVGAGISNWATYYNNTDIPAFTRQFLKATPWKDPEIYRLTSPVTFLKRAKTPMLIQHGDQDKRVPIANAFELYRGLRDHNVPAKLVMYPNMGHVVNKPKELLAIKQQNREWFGKWVWGEDSKEIETLSSLSNAEKKD